MESFASHFLTLFNAPILRGNYLFTNKEKKSAPFLVSGMKTEILLSLEM